MTASELTGHCLCGAVGLTVSHPPGEMHVCHCSMCRRWTGSPMMTLEVPAASLAVQGGENVVTYASSGWAARSFCGTCGSSLWYRLTLEGAADACFIAAGLFDDPSGLTLTTEVHIDAKPAGYAFAGPTRQLTEAEILSAVGISSPEELSR